MCDALGAVEGDLQDPVVITGLGSARDGYSMEQGARSEEQVPEGDGDLVDFLDDEPVVVEDDSLRDLVRLGTLLEVTG